MLCEHCSPVAKTLVQCPFLSLEVCMARRISETWAWLGGEGRCISMMGASGSTLVVAAHCQLSKRVHVGGKLTGLALL